MKEILKIKAPAIQINFKNSMGCDITTPVIIIGVEYKVPILSSFLLDCEYESGFISTKNNFVDREEAMKIAFNSKQVDKSIAINQAWWNTFGWRSLQIEQDEMRKYNCLFLKDIDL
jgi:hypothetical protein